MAGKTNERLQGRVGLLTPRRCLESRGEGGPPARERGLAMRLQHDGGVESEQAPERSAEALLVERAGGLALGGPGTRCYREAAASCPDHRVGDHQGAVPANEERRIPKVDAFDGQRLDTRARRVLRSETPGRLEAEPRDGVGVR